MLLNELVEVSEAVAKTGARTRKTELLAGVLSRLPPEEAAAAISYLTGAPVQAPLGVGHAALRKVDVPAGARSVLTIRDVDNALELISTTGGPGSIQRKHELLNGLFARATKDEQGFLRGLISRNLRQGALEGVMADAVAQALGVSADRIRRAAMLEGDLVVVAAKALSGGVETLETTTLEIFTPVKPMLAKTANTVSEAIAGLGMSVVEHKLDGLRIQVHKERDRIEVYTRNLRRVTAGMDAVLETVKGFSAGSLILDGEGLLVTPEGTPRSFQESMSGRAQDHPESFAGFYFDLLHIEGEDLIDVPLGVRRRRLVEAVPDEWVVESIETKDPGSGERFYERAVETGFEGVVVKDPTQPYAAGRRGSGWLKVKPTHTLDLVILAAEWGSGRRHGWLSNLHLGALGEDGELVMLGKTFKGLTDEMLAWQTERFLQIEQRRVGNIVYLRPEIVYEIAFDGVQRSTRYPGGVALRFARVKGYRADKSPYDADTLNTVRSFMR